MSSKSVNQMIYNILEKRSAFNKSNNPQPMGDHRIVIVDIGSNTVRLVVFDAPARLPVPILNERVVCSLGKGLGETGKLNPKGAALAMKTLGRFMLLTREMRVAKFVFVATAAIREAKDGKKFVEDVEK